MADFPDVTNLALEVEQPHTGPHNLVVNPNGDIGGWGWRAELGTSGAERATVYSTTYPVASPDAALAIAPAVIGGPDAKVGSNLFTVSPGKYASIYAELLDTPAPSVVFNLKFFNATGGVIESTGVTRNTAGTARYIRLVPAGAVTGQLLITCDTSGLPGPNVKTVLRHVTVAQYDTNVGTAALTYLDPAPTYTNVLGSVLRCSIVREDLNLAELNATIKDATLDPATTDLLRPGRRVRLTVTAGAWADAVLFLGRIDGTPTTYDLEADDGTKRTVINLRAVDDLALLANTPAPNGYASLEEVTNALELVSVVPWNVNGDGSQRVNDTPITTNPDAKALDQVVITRDTHHAFAWMSREGVMHVADDAHLDPVERTLTEAEYSADGPEITWDVDQVINDITITHVLRNAITGETTQVTWGPYQDLASVREWGVRHRDFTVQGLTNDDATMRAWASAVFATNAQPATRVRSVTCPVRLSTFDAPYPVALADLYDLWRVTNDLAGVDQSNRVTRLEHTITPGDWDVTLTFSLDGGSPAGNVPSVTPPVVAAGPPAVTVGVTTPEKPHREAIKTSTQSIATSGSTVTVSGWTGVQSAGGIAFSGGVATVPRAGRYLITTTATFAGNAVGRRRAGIYKNGTAVYLESCFPSSTSPADVAVSGLLVCAVNDTLELRVGQNSGAALDLTAAYISITYLD
jgi:hypothetical protein